LRDDSWRWAARCDLASGANWAVNPAVHDSMTMFSNGGPRPGYSWVAIQRARQPKRAQCHWVAEL